MSNHLTLQVIKRHSEQTLSPSEVVAVDDHLTICDDCYARFQEVTQLPDRFTTMDINLSAELSQELHQMVSDEQIVAYISNELNEIDREIVESHLEFCSSCANEVRELQEFKKTVDEHSIQKERAFVRQPTLSTKFFAMFRLLSPQWNPPYIVGMAAIVGVFLLTGVLLYRAGMFDRQVPLAQRVNVNGIPFGQANLPSNTSNKQKNIQKESTKNRNSGTNLDGPAKGNKQPGFDAPDSIIALKGLSPATQQAVRTALATKEIKKPDELVELSGAINGLRGGSPADDPQFNLISPASTVIQSDSPTFRWHTLNGATGYVVSVFNTKTNQVIKSERLSETKWTVSSPLQRGVIYSWQVTALRDDENIVSPKPPAPEVQFKVLEKEKVIGLARELKRSANSHLISGVLYAQYGLVDEAEREFQALVKANPRSRIAVKLLRSVQSWRP